MTEHVSESNEFVAVCNTLGELYVRNTHHNDVYTPKNLLSDSQTILFKDKSKLSSPTKERKNIILTPKLPSIVTRPVSSKSNLYSLINEVSVAPNSIDITHVNNNNNNNKRRLTTRTLVQQEQGLDSDDRLSLVSPSFPSPMPLPSPENVQSTIQVQSALVVLEELDRILHPLRKAKAIVYQAIELAKQVEDIQNIQRDMDQAPSKITEQDLFNRLVVRQERNKHYFFSARASLALLGWTPAGILTGYKVTCICKKMKSLGVSPKLRNVNKISEDLMAMEKGEKVRSVIRKTCFLAPTMIHDLSVPKKKRKKQPRKGLEGLITAIDEYKQLYEDCYEDVKMKVARGNYLYFNHSDAPLREIACRLKGVTLHWQLQELMSMNSTACPHCGYVMDIESSEQVCVKCSLFFHVESPFLAN